MDSKVIDMLESIKNSLNCIMTRLQYDGEIVQKSGNSINIIIRILAGMMKIKTADLTEVLKKNDGIMHVLQPFEESNYNSSNLNSDKYPVEHLRSMLLELVNTIDSMSKVTQNGQGPDSPSLLNIPSTSSQADTSYILPNVELNSDVPQPTISQKKITPVITKNYKASVLLRRYRNKYRYLRYKYVTLYRKKNGKKMGKKMKTKLQNVRDAQVVKYKAKTPLKHFKKKESGMVLNLSKYSCFFQNFLKGPLNFIDADTLPQRYRRKEETEKPSENKNLNGKKSYETGESSDESSDTITISDITPVEFSCIPCDEYSN